MARGKAATGAKKGGSAGRKVEAPREEVQSPDEEEFDTPQEEVEQEGAEGAEEVEQGEQGASGSAPQPKKSNAANLMKVGFALKKGSIFSVAEEHRPAVRLLQDAAPDAGQQGRQEDQAGGRRLHGRCAGVPRRGGRR